MNRTLDVTVKAVSTYQTTAVNEDPPVTLTHSVVPPVEVLHPVSLIQPSAVSPTPTDTLTITSPSLPVHLRIRTANSSEAPAMLPEPFDNANNLELLTQQPPTSFLPERPQFVDSSLHSPGHSPSNQGSSLWERWEQTWSKVVLFVLAIWLHHEVHYLECRRPQ
ncbi:unnamed protein product [Calypogeia fissa]